MLAYGDLRNWKAADLVAASDAMRADLKVLEKAHDALEDKAAPDSWIGLSGIGARFQVQILLAQMAAHIEGLWSFEREIFLAHDPVVVITDLVGEIDHTARDQQFQIGADGAISDVAPPKQFESATAAEQHTLARIAQRDALVSRVEDVLDKAFAVDSTLLHARPTDSFSADGPRGVVDPQVQRAWAEMSDAEREAVLENMADELAEGYDLSDFEIRFEDLEDQDGDGVDDDPDTDLHGSWSDDDRVLRIDLNNLSEAEMINTVAHEVRHAYQNEAVRDNDPGALDGFLEGLGLKDDPWDPAPGVTRDDAEDWAENFDDYQTSEDDGFDAYFNQPVETDARESGAEYIDGLTGDDLERHREEAR